MSYNSIPQYKIGMMDSILVIQHCTILNDGQWYCLTIKNKCMIMTMIMEKVDIWWTEYSGATVVTGVEYIDI